jgi:serine/threonine protein kinase
MAADMPVDSFLDLLRQSGLVVDSQMLALMAEFSGGDNGKWESARPVAAELIQRGILTKWQADNLLEGKHRGFILGTYRILQSLGKGGMSQVYLAEHIMMRRRCAIKVLPAKYQEDPDLLDRFHLEARAIAALDHPHIVRAYDFNTHIDPRTGKKTHYLVMEYVEGQDLRRMVEEQGPLDYRKAADFIRQAAEGLVHAHAAGFVHRDIKPANLLVDPNGVLKILDLGLALEGQEAWETSERQQQSAVGTADYVAPEQVMDSRNVDGRADIYSLGYTFYFLLTGRRPFPKSTLVELLMAHRVENPEPISNLRPDVPLELIEIIDRMTAKTPDLRFQTAKDVAEKLQTWLHDSESRDYSRISALMAAAMRAKQPGSEGPAGKPESTAKQTELELTFLDDDPPKPAGTKAVESHRTEGAKLPETAAREKPRRLGPSDSGRTAALRPGDSGKTAALSMSKADLLAELNAQPTLGARPQFRHRSGANNVLKSPWLWIALAGLVCALFLLLAILANVLSDKPDQHTPKKLAQRNDVPSATSPSSIPPPQAQAAGHRESPKTAKQDHGSSTKAATPSSLSSPAPPSESPVQEPPPTKPSTPPPEPAPAEKPPEKKDNPEPPRPQSEKPADVDKEKLLANVKQLSFHVADPDTANKPMYTIVQHQAREAIEAFDPAIKFVPTSPNVLELDLKASTAADSPGLVLTAELKCRAPDGSNVTVWKLSEPVVVPRARQDTAAGKMLLISGTQKFFKKFVVDVRKTRSKVKLDSAEQPPK